MEYFFHEIIVFMRIVGIYLLLVLLVLNVTACTRNNKKTYMNSKFSWSPSIGAPLNYPCEAKYGFVRFGSKDAIFPVMDRRAGHGIGRSGGSVALNGLDGMIGLPKSMEVVWLSRAEVRFFEANLTFSDELREKMGILFEQGYYQMNGSEYRTYNNFIMTLLPGGRVLLYLSGARRIAYLGSVQAKEIFMKLDDFTEDAYVGETLGEYAVSGMNDAAKENFQKNGIPYSLWDKYLERFTYKIRIEFENPISQLAPDYRYSFTNGEWFSNDDGVAVDSLARLKDIHFEWSVGDVEYEGHFFLNEDDVLEIFDCAYGNNHNQPGEFVIKVSKYNNWFDVFLRVGEKEYKFEKAQIHVFRRRPEDDKGCNFYDNYRGQAVTKYIGE